MIAKQLVRIGVVHMEAAVSMVLLRCYPNYMRAADVGRSTGMKEWDAHDGAISAVLRKMEKEGRVEARYVNDRARGWKLTETEYRRFSI